MINTRTPPLEFRAGPAALARIRDGGLAPEMVRVIAGAAGGPKWLALNGLDQALFGHWLRDASHSIHLVGSSIATWRFACAAQKDPLAAMARFAHAYIEEQRYTRRPDTAEVDRAVGTILDQLLGENGSAEILSHPVWRMNILAVRARGMARSEKRAAVTASMASAALLNLAGRRNLRLLFERVLFHDPREQPPFAGMRGFPLLQPALNTGNLRAALLASAAIPGLMSGVRDIPGAPPGVYRDGGLLDYHLAIPYGVEEGIVLYPHFARHVLPGWFDKLAPWRRARGSDLDHVLLLRPSREWLASLPGGRIPDRHDFYRYAGHDQERIRAWRQATEAGRQLADHFMEAVASERIRQEVKLLR